MTELYPGAAHMIAALDVLGKRRLLSPEVLRAAAKLERAIIQERRARAPDKKPRRSERVPLRAK